MSARDIFYFIRALVALCVRPRRTLPSSVQTVAVLAPAKMGDMVCTTPVFHALRLRVPSVRIVVVGDKTNEALMAGSPDIDRYIVYTQNHPESAARALKEVRIDVAILTVPSAAGLAFLALSGSKMIIAPTIVGGWSPHETKLYRLLRMFVATAEHHFGAYVPGEYLRLLLPLGITETDTTKHLTVSPASLAQADSLLRSYKRPWIGIAPGAGNKIKLWPSERFAAVADYCTEKIGATVVVIAGTRDEADVKKMIAAVKSKNSIVDLTAKLSVEELKAVVARIDLLVASDTGPIYVAEALGTSTVDIVGPVAEHEQPPQGPKHISVMPVRVAPAIHIMSASVYDAAEVKRQSESITVRQVTDALDQVLAKSRSVGRELQ